MPSKRVSLKGKGADLFFGGQQTAAPETDEREPIPSPTTPSPLDQDGSESSYEDAKQPAPTTVTTRDTRPQRTRSRQTTKNGAVEASRDMSHLSPDGASGQQESQHASTLASFDDETIDSIRKVVKVVGRDVSFVRLSAEEKRRLAGIVYTYKMQGIKTSENEINRIAINLLLEDYETNGEQSVLGRVLAALQA